MSHFAEIDKDGTVLRVIVIEPEMLATGRWGDPANWVQTSYTGSVRKNYAGVGYTYDKARDAFIAPKPSDDATLDEKTAQWMRAPMESPATEAPGVVGVSEVRA